VDANLKKDVIQGTHHYLKARNNMACGEPHEFQGENKEKQISRFLLRCFFFLSFKFFFGQVASLEML
jgi:hypothetical protein